MSVRKESVILRIILEVKRAFPFSVVVVVVVDATIVSQFRNVAPTFDRRDCNGAIPKGIVFIPARIRERELQT